MWIGILFFALMVLFSILIRCENRVSSAGAQEFNLSDPEKRTHIILRVEESFYFNSDYENHLNFLVGDEYKTFDPVSLSRLMDDFIESKLFLGAARKVNLTVSWQEQKQHLAKLSNESWANTGGNTSDEVETGALLERLKIEKYMYEVVKDIEVGDEEIKNYYDINKREFLRPERVAVSQILLDTEEKAVEVLERVKDSSEESFRQMARDVSSGVEAEIGGEMGVFEMNQLPAEMERVVFLLKEGEISQVVESAYGFHIFRLDKKLKSELEAFENVISEIRIKILDNKIRQYISQHLLDLKKTMDWEFYPQNLSFPYQRNTNE